MVSAKTPQGDRNTPGCGWLVSGFGKVLAADREPVEDVEGRDHRDAQGGREQAEQGAGGEPAQGQEEPAADGGRGGRAQSPAEQAVVAGVEPDDVEGQGGGAEREAVEDDGGALTVAAAQGAGQDR